jgi:hypothetical protein
LLLLFPPYNAALLGVGWGEFSGGKCPAQGRLMPVPGKMCLLAEAAGLYHNFETMRFLMYGRRMAYGR